MLGRLRRRPVLHAGRRSPRRIVGWCVLAAALAIVIGEVTADVVSSSDSVATMQARTFAAAVAPIADESTALRFWITEVRRDPLQLGRDGITAALGRLVTECTQVLQQFETLGIAPPSPAPGRLFDSVLRLRLRAAEAFSGTVAVALGPDATVPAVATRLDAVGRVFALSDGRYRRFLTALPSVARRSARLRPSVWAGSANWSKASNLTYARLLVGARSLHRATAVSIVAVTLEPPALRISGLPATTTTTSTTPTTSSTTTTTSSTTTTTSTSTTTTTVPGAPTTSSTLPTTTTTTSSTTTTSTTTTTTTLQVPPPGSTSWLPPTSSLFVVVVVANGGGSAARDVTISAIAVPIAPRQKKAKTAPSPLPPATSSRAVIRSLGGGSSVELRLPVLHVRPGTGYELSVRLGSQVERIRLEVAQG